MKHLAGPDVSLDETAVCVVDEAGGIAREARVPGEPEAPVAFFRSLRLAVERVGLEACSLAAWLHEGLVAASLPALCIETRRAEAAMGRCRMRPTATTRVGSPRSSVPGGTGRCT